MRKEYSGTSSVDVYRYRFPPVSPMIQTVVLGKECHGLCRREEGPFSQFIFIFISKELCRILVMIKRDVRVRIFGSDCFMFVDPHGGLL